MWIASYLRIDFSGKGWPFLPALSFFTQCPRTRAIHCVVQTRGSQYPAAGRADENGKVRTGEDIGTGSIDTTAGSMQRARARLAEVKSP